MQSSKRGGRVVEEGSKEHIPRPSNSMNHVRLKSLCHSSRSADLVFSLTYLLNGTYSVSFGSMVLLLVINFMFRCEEGRIAVRWNEDAYR